MTQEKRPRSCYAAQVDVDQVQSYVLETNKLREMLGASRLVDRVVDEADKLSNSSIRVLWPVSGSVVLWAAESAPLIRATQGIRQWLNERGVDHTVSLVGPLDPAPWYDDASGNALTERVFRQLAERAGRRKARRATHDATPRCALFAPCSINGFEPANHWEPTGHRVEKEPRRTLVGFRSRAKYKAWESGREAKRREIAPMLSSAFVERYGKNYGLDTKARGAIEEVLQPAIQFDDLIASDLEGAQDEAVPKTAGGYLALVKADGDGVGTLLANMNWNSLDWSSTASGSKLPWERARDFARALDRATRMAVNEAVADATWELAGKTTDNGRRPSLIDRVAEAVSAHGALDGVVKLPVLPLLFGGDDLWLLTRREIAIDFCLTFASRFMQEAKGGILADAVAVSGHERALTMSSGVVFAKSGYPFDPMFQMASDLLVSAKEARKQAGANSAWIDCHWLASSSRVTLDQARRRGYLYKDEDSVVSTTTRPWSVDEVEALSHGVEVISGAGFPRRKLRQLDSIVRRGVRLSELAWMTWLQHLAPGERDVVIGVLGQLPGRLQLKRPEQSPWLTEPETEGATRRQHSTPVLDLLELRAARYREEYEDEQE